MFKFGSNVTLTANPDPTTGRFNVWTSGACSGTTNPCTFTVPSGGTSANGAFGWFATLTILKNMGDTGFAALTSKATTSDGQINCTNTTSLLGTCFANFGRNAQVTLQYQ